MTKRKYGDFISGISNDDTIAEDQAITVRVDALEHDDFFTYDGKEYKFDIIVDGIANVIQVKKVMVNTGHPTLTEHIHGVARVEMPPDTQVTHTGHDTG